MLVRSGLVIVHVASCDLVKSLGVAAAESAAAPPSLQDLLRVELQILSWSLTLFYLSFGSFMSLSRRHSIGVGKSSIQCHLAGSSLSMGADRPVDDHTVVTSVMVW